MTLEWLNKQKDQIIDLRAEMLFSGDFEVGKSAPEVEQYFLLALSCLEQAQRQMQLAFLTKERLG